jgi:ParB family chromosome partitioning protein
MDTRNLLTSLIDPPSNRHRVTLTEESIVDLAKDIRDKGLLNPITVRPMGERFEVVAGERRYTAIKFLGWPMIECRVTEPLTDEQCEGIRLAENLQRENLSPYEEAIQISALIILHNGEYELAAKACHRSAAWVKERFALFNVQEDLQPLVHHKQLSIGAALQLKRVENDSDRAYYTRLAMYDGCTVPVLTRWVDDYITQKMISPDAQPTMPNIPAPGQPILVYLDCNLCHDPADTRTRQPKFVCVKCQKIWDDFTAAYREANAALDQQQTTEEHAS